MKKPAMGGVRYSAADSLYRRHQKLVSQLQHRASERETLEHALSLVLSEDRPCERVDHLIRNVVRDARRTLARRRAAHPEVDVESLGDTLAACNPTPEDLLIAKEAFTEMVGLAEQLSVGAVASFEGLLEEESVEETAARSDLSPRQVRHLRSQLRARIASLPMYAEAA